MDDFFNAGDDDNAATTEAAAATESTDATNESGAIALGMESGGNTDYFAGMDASGGDASSAVVTGDATQEEDGQDGADGAGDAAPEEKQGNDEPTFLSVWQEQRRIELQKRRDTEVEEQRTLQATAETELNEFHGNRSRKIDAKKKENRDKEDGLKQDLNSVFKHGTLWEQVGRLVNLQEMKNNDEDSVDRMRNLLIHLKNIKQKS